LENAPKEGHVHLMLGFLQSKGLRAAIIRVNLDNEASLKVPLRCGFDAIPSFV